MQNLLLLPLAQLNATPGAPTPAAPAPAAPAATPEVAAPAVTPVAGAPATSGAGTATSTAPGSTTQPATPPGLFGNLLGFAPIALMLVVLYFVLFRGQRKEEKRRKGLIAELKKNDQVMTIGGMLAKVVSIDGDEVVLKIDEAANVKATYRKSAIQEVITRDDSKKP